MRYLLTYVVMLSLLLIGGSASRALAEPTAPHVVLISLDGFRHDYIEMHDASSLAALATRGVQADRLVPVYPSNTFPNHLSIMTGLRPVNHGIVNNDFFDKRRVLHKGYGHYSMGKGTTDSTWISALPLWNLAEFQGLTAATYFWPESDARINGALPTYHYPYSKHADYQQRIDQIIAWLRLPAAQRPQFIAGYFSLVDTAGHDHGPGSAETRAAVKRVDALIGQLHQRLAALPLAVNLIVVSDHGMAQLEPEAVIRQDSLPIDEQTFVAQANGAQIMLYARQGATQQAISAQKAALQRASEGRYVVLSQAERQQRHYAAGPRTGDIVLETMPPSRFAGPDDHYTSLGGHGYEPGDEDMGGLFVATGPAFRQGVTLPAVSNLEIYPLIAGILSLPLLSEIDGELDVLASALKDAKTQ